MGADVRHGDAERGFDALWSFEPGGRVVCRWELLQKTNPILAHNPRKSVCFTVISTGSPILSE